MYKRQDRNSLTLVGRARFERDGDSWQVSLYHEVDYLDFQNRLQKQGFSLPTADEWAYLCGGGCRTLFPWGDGLDYSMRLRWFEDMDEDENRPYDCLLYTSGHQHQKADAGHDRPSGTVAG